MREFVHRGFNRKLYTPGGDFNREVMDFAPSAGIVIGRKLQNMVIVSACLVILFLGNFQYALPRQGCNQQFSWIWSNMEKKYQLFL